MSLYTWVEEKITPRGDIGAGLHVDYKTGKEKYAVEIPVRGAHGKR